MKGNSSHVTRSARGRIAGLPAAPGGRAAACGQCPVQGACAIGSFLLPACELPVSVHKLDEGQQLCRAADPLCSLYVIRHGSLMTRMITASGSEQALGLFLPGQLVGTDAIGEGRHQSDAIALEMAEICELPYAWLIAAAGRTPMLQHRLLCLLSENIAYSEAMMILLGRSSVSQRLATWLLDFEQRHGVPNGNEYMTLPVTRRTLGNFLGIAVETVSRVLSQFRRQRLIDIHHRGVRILDRDRLRAIAGPAFETLSGLRHGRWRQGLRPPHDASSRMH